MCASKVFAFFFFPACVSANQSGCHVNGSLFALTVYYSILSILHTSRVSAAKGYLCHVDAHQAPLCHWKCYFRVRLMSHHLYLGRQLLS